METHNSEGCGREGPIRCIFLAEFHPVAGPRIACQCPEDYMSREMFDTISAYIIPKPQMCLHKCTMTINALGHKFIGYPIRLDNTRYERNAYLFNLCFVCDSWSKTIQYEPVVKKLGEHLTRMEEEARFVSCGATKLPTMLALLLRDLNTHRQATLVEGDTVMHFQVVQLRNEPPQVNDHDVPVMVSCVGLPRPARTAPSVCEDSIYEGSELFPECNDEVVLDVDADWDLTTRQLLPYINGYNHISKIAILTNVEKTLIKSCIQNLIYYGVVILIPILKFSNMYRATPSMKRIFSDKQLQKACLNFITGNVEGKMPSLPHIQRILCALQQGTTLHAVCDKYVTGRGVHFDIHRLITFALLHGLIRPLAKSGDGCPTDVPPITLNGSPLSRVDKLKYLGHYVTFDEADIKRERRTLSVRANIFFHGLPYGSRNRVIGLRVPSERPSLPLLPDGICETIPNEWPVLLRYPVYLNQGRVNGVTRKELSEVQKMCDGEHCIDEICATGIIDLPSLEKMIEDDINIAVIWK